MIDQALIKEFCRENGYAISETFSTPYRPERRIDLPYGYTDPAYKQILQARGIEDGRIWVHQAEAMEAISSGLNAVLSTATNSGKSLMFQLPAIRKLRDSDGNDRVMVVYPTKALNSDQMLSWRQIMHAAGYDESALAIIDGDVPVDKRLDILEKARVLLMTPDVVHAWMMSNLDKPVIREFIGNLSLKVLDEAHLYEGAFGTNMSYLLNRLTLAQQILNPHYRSEHHDQIILATATLNDPGRFAQQLITTNTYANTYLIGDDLNTATQQVKTFTVIRTPDRKQRIALKKLLFALHHEHSGGGILSFIDSRIGVDTMANDLAVLGKDGVPAYAAYRAGFVEEDRLAVENGLRNGTLRGVMATSGLEVGIDIGGIKTVLLDTLPKSPASFRQRAGRLRNGGDVIILEDDDNLRALGMTVEKYLDQPPAQPVFYRSNPKIFAEQAQCLLAEEEQLSDVDAAAPKMMWPAGFTDVVEAYRTKPMAELTKVQLEAIPPGDTDPHLYHSMRFMDGPIHKIKMYDSALKVTVNKGDLTQGQGLTEGLPGMRMTIAGRNYKVQKWGPGGASANIHISPVSREENLNPKTRALVTTKTTISLNDQSVLRQGLRTNGPDNFMASVNLRIKRIGTGFSERVDKEVVHTIFDESAPSEGIVRSRKGRTVIRTGKYGPPRRAPINTTGVVIRIGEKVLSNHGLNRVAYALKAALCDVAKISPNDIGVLTQNILVLVRANRFTNDRAILIYDKTPGSLLFSNKLMTYLEKVTARLSENAAKDAYSVGVANAFIGWATKLKRVRVPTYDEWARAGIEGQAKANEIEVYAPGSQLTWIRDGLPQRVEVEKAEVVSGELMYKVRRVKSEYTHFKTKGTASIGKKVYRPEEKLFAKPHELEPTEGRASHRFDLFDVKKNRYVGTDGASLRDLLTAGKDVIPPEPT